MILHAVALNLGQVLPSGNIQRYFGCQSGGRGVTSNGYRPGMLLNILQYIQQRIVRPKMSVVLRLRNFVLRFIQLHWSHCHSRTLPDAFYQEIFLLFLVRTQTIPGHMQFPGIVPPTPFSDFYPHWPWQILGSHCPGQFYTIDLRGTFCRSSEHFLCIFFLSSLLSSFSSLLSPSILPSKFLVTSAYLNSEFQVFQ